MDAKANSGGQWFDEIVPMTPSLWAAVKALKPSPRVAVLSTQNDPDNAVSRSPFAAFWGMLYLEQASRRAVALDEFEKEPTP